MKNQTVFKRYEIKYLITKQQKNEITEMMHEYMEDDEYGKSTLCNIYFDSDDYLLIRRSIEKPIYKEKLRIRSYGLASLESKAYVEMKKKYKSVVYKRRIAMKEADAMHYVCNKITPQNNTQITHELNYFLSLYENLAPKVFLSYEREAFYAKNDENFRITFDENILWRDYDFSLCAGIYGDSILPEEKVLMEIKTVGAIPLWLTDILTKNKIYKTSFSKYANAYKQLITKQKEYQYNV
ncbi:MAG: polyphosphate polymerase domain-containing protein [Anaerorhabdus sp.]